MICAQVCVLLIMLSSVIADQMDANNSIYTDNVLKRLLKDSDAMKSSLMEYDVNLATQSILNVLSDVSILPKMIQHPTEHIFIEEIAKIIDNVNAFKVDIMNIGQNIDRLINYHELFELRTHISLDVGYIDNCLEWFLNYLRDPMSNHQQLYSCYNIFTKHISDYGKLLNEEPVAFYNNKIYHQIIELKGYCDGTRVLNVFQYILGIYSEGCIAAVAVESMKYNYSTLIMQECQSNIQKGLLLFHNTTYKCKMHDCEKVISIIREKANESDVHAVAKSLRRIFPWYYFLIIFYNDEADPDIEFFGETLSRVEIPSSGKVTKLIMWAEFINNYTHADTNVYEYGVGYIRSSANSSIDQMHMNIWYKPGDFKVRLIGYHSFVGSEKVKPRCLFDQSEKKSTNFDWKIYLETWKLYLIYGFGVILDLTLANETCKKWKKRKKYMGSE